MTQEIKSNESEGNTKDNAEESNEVSNAVNNEVSSTAENSITKAYSNDVAEAKVTDEKVIENVAPVELTGSAFTIVRHDNGIAHLVIDVIGENVNTLKAEFTEQVNAVLAEIKADKAITGIVLCSGKKGSFVAGCFISTRTTNIFSARAIAYSYCCGYRWSMFRWRFRTGYGMPCSSL